MSERACPTRQRELHAGRRGGRCALVPSASQLGAIVRSSRAGRAGQGGTLRLNSCFDQNLILIDPPASLSRVRALSAMSASPAPDQSGQSTPAPNDTSKSQTPAPAPPAKPQPSPLDGLSPAELRKKLEDGRALLRTQIEKKRKLDRDLVRSRDARFCVSPPSCLDSDALAVHRPYSRRQSTRSRGPTSRTRSCLRRQRRTQPRPRPLNSETSFGGTIHT